MRTALLAACCLIVAAGCGSDDPKPESSILTFEARGTSSVFVLGNRAQRVPLGTIYSVFRRAQRPAEASLAAEDVGCGTGSEDEEEEGPGMGEPRAKTARILLRDVGTRGYELVALSTTRDAVSLSLEPGGSAICAQPTAGGLAFAAELGKRDGIVFGLVGDGVTAVDVVVDGVERRAQLGENGFALTIPDAAGKTLDRIVLRRENGSTITFPRS